jgi:hypothetical protein
MTRKPVELEITHENIGSVLKAGDIIVEAEELGTVVSARNTVHNNGTAFVYFMGGDCYKETFGVPRDETEKPVRMTVLRETEGPEYEWRGRPLGTHVMVEISKAGGGTVGKRYQGTWSYRITQNGKVVAEGDDLRTGMPKTHEEAARIAWGFQDDGYDDGEDD